MKYASIYSTNPNARKISFSKMKPLKLNKIPKYENGPLWELIDKLSFTGLPFKVKISAGWIPNEHGNLKLMLDVNLLSKNRDNLKKSIRLYSYTSDGVVKNLPKGKFLPESFVLSVIRSHIIELLRHEVDEFMKLDGHRVFDPHTRTGRSRVRKGNIR